MPSETSTGRCLVLLLAVLAGLFAACGRGAKPEEPERKLKRSCAADDLFDLRLGRDPLYRARFEELQRRTVEWIDRFKESEGAALRTSRTVIPVVVHVLWNEAADNVSDAQIQSQFPVLNADYRAANADLGTAPAAFQALAGDSLIEFQLAVRDPDCGATDGITRTEVTKSFYVAPDEDAKSSAQGGVDPWPTDRYLNIWIVPEVRDGNDNVILGYSSFPADPANLQGVVIPHEFFGTTGTVSAPFDLGRTTSHELGHFFNLRHIWADDQHQVDPCAGTDFVDDTPNQDDPNFGCPTFPAVSCSNAPDGDMFVSYMDYVDDACMVMFSQGQVERMAAALYTAHTGLLGSDGLIPPPAVAAGDLFSQDSPEDVGDEPNALTADFWRSEDIWVRNQQDGLTNQEHQNPVHRPTGPSNFVYVRVRNRGCADAASATLRLYWAKASTGLSWPAPWDASVTSPALMGNAIGSLPTGAVTAGDFTVLEFAWSPANPGDYASFGADRVHFCLLARIETDTVSPFGMAIAEGPSLEDNVRNNNDIVWKNVSIIEPGPSGNREAAVIAANYGWEALKAAFGFGKPQRDEASMFAAGRVILELDPKLQERWSAGGRQGQGFEDLGDGRVLMLRHESYLAGIELLSQEIALLQVVFEPDKLAEHAEVYVLDVVQYDGEPRAGRRIGGQRIVWKKP